MNERIRELAEQCGFVYNENFGLTADVNADAAKFAELIIEDCLDTISYGGEYVNRVKLVEQLKSHFGVE